MSTQQLAQLNIARPLAPLDDPAMGGFVGALATLNAVADATPGFVWRLREEGTGDATGLRPFGPDIMVNMSVWASVEALRDYVYRSAHLESLRRRREWFTHDGVEPHLVLWWIAAGTVPTLDEAWERREWLRRYGPGPRAFTLREAFPASDQTRGFPGGASGKVRELVDEDG